MLITSRKISITILIRFFLDIARWDFDYFGSNKYLYYILSINIRFRKLKIAADYSLCRTTPNHIKYISQIHFLQLTQFMHATLQLCSINPQLLTCLHYRLPNSLTGNDVITTIFSLGPIQSTVLSEWWIRLRLFEARADIKCLHNQLPW